MYRVDYFHSLPRGGSRIFERGGVQIRSTSKKGGPDGGQILGPMLKSLHRGTKRGGGVRTPPLDLLLLPRKHVILNKDHLTKIGKVKIKGPYIFITPPKYPQYVLCQN